MHVVVGRPIEFEKNLKPTPEEVYIYTTIIQLLCQLVGYVWNGIGDHVIELDKANTSTTYLLLG